ncbi:GntR family transcriptional regulator [Eubacterium barkeri]|uniref:GntR family transcriptional regulator n=1 Tax=Eubacterium barkeri TaxID=1528 RepID=A0A1H3JLJ2_EUBBA|nr:GntR family transcriptional regulator [Eubacterium barkeri]SDY40757.1 GntR family transcriptional regulator [Eubacterium barkeri]
MKGFFEDLTLDKQSKIPLYAQVEAFLIERIKNKDLKPGDYLPPEEELASFYKISRPTVRHALQSLVQKGYVERQKAKGTRVLNRKVDGDFFNKILSFDDEMIEKGIVPSTKVIAFHQVELPEKIKEKFGNESNKGIYLERVRYGDGIPMVHTVTYLPYTRCFGILNCDLEKIPLYHAMRECLQDAVVRAKRSIQAMDINGEIAKWLDCNSGDSVLHIETEGYDHLDHMIEYSIATYHGERNIFQIELRI